jgi:outer membrane receptor protein involved in Fe transport
MSQIQARRSGWISAFALLLFPGASTAGTTGSLSGTVTDASGEPLIGASVMVEDTRLGAVTDADGHYFILALPPGTYTVDARMVGMTEVSKEGIRVIADQTSRVDFQLGISPVGRTVIEVTDQRSLVLETVPSTIHVLDFREMRLMPVPDLLDILRRQPGIVSQGGAMHVRGGRPGEVAFLLDGIPVRSPMTNSFASIVPLTAISETSITTGGMSAEYGNAMSGVVNMVSRDGGSELTGDVLVRSGDLEEIGSEEIARNYSEPSENDTYRGDAIDVECALGGPEPFSSYLLPAIGVHLPGDVTFFGTARYLRSGRNLVDSRGYWENNWQNGFTGSMKVTSRPSVSTRVTVLGFYNYRQSGWDEWAWSRFDQPAYIEGEPYLGDDPDYAIPIRFQETGGVTGSITQMLSDATYIDLKFNQNRFCHWRRIRSADGGYVGEGYSPGDWLTGFYPVPRVADSLGFYHAGIHPEVWLESRSTVTNARIDLTSRLSGILELKTGVEGAYYDIYDYSVYADSPGNTYVSLWEAWPHSAAAYAQTLWRFSGGMVMNTGLRFDMFAPNSRMLDIESGDAVDVPNKYQVSPRFGITHPVTDRDVFFGTYGHYFQMPNMNEMFFGTDYSLSGLYSIVGNPDLQAERTSAYEVGVRHRFTDTSSLGLSAFSKDITGLVRTSEYFSETYNYYFVYENDDSHATVRGLEVKLLKLPGGWWSGSAGYSYSIARGRYSSPTEAYEYESGGFVVNPTGDSYLDWDQRHTADAHLTLDMPRGEGPRVSGYPLLEGSTLNLDWSYGSGFPFSPPTGGSVEPEINTERYPSTMQTDLGVTRRFWAAGMGFEAGMTVYNLFNNRNLDKIFDAGYYLETGHPGGVMDNPGAWSPARHLFFRLGVSW